MQLADGSRLGSAELFVVWQVAKKKGMPLHLILAHMKLVSYQEMETIVTLNKGTMSQSGSFLRKTLQRLLKCHLVLFA